MSWARLDDGFYDNPKILGVDLAAVGLYAVGLSYAGKQLTDGHLTHVVARHLSRGDAALVTQLVEAKLWIVTPDGYAINDFLQFNPSHKSVERQRKEARQRMQSLRIRSREHPPSRSREQVNTGCLGDGTGRDGTGRVKKSSSVNARARAVPDGFDTFWAAYPRKENKAAAVKAWDKLAPDDGTRQAITGALAWQRALPRWLESGGQYVPHPATYLNGRRWEDERPAESPPPLSAAQAKQARTLEVIRQAMGTRPGA
jgi:hypothetical protein